MFIDDLKFFQLALLLIIFLPIIGAGVLLLITSKTKANSRLSSPHGLFQIITWFVMLLALALPILHRVPDQQLLIEYLWFPEPVSYTHLTLPTNREV